MDLKHRFWILTFRFSIRSLKEKKKIWQVGIPMTSFQEGWSSSWSPFASWPWRIETWSLNFQGWNANRYKIISYWFSFICRNRCIFEHEKRIFFRRQGDITVLIRDPRTASSAHRSVRVGAIFFGFYWFWCGAVRVFQKFIGTGPTGSGAWIPGLDSFYRTIRIVEFNWSEFPDSQQIIFLEAYLNEWEKSNLYFHISCDAFSYSASLEFIDSGFIESSLSETFWFLWRWQCCEGDRALPTPQKFWVIWLSMIKDSHCICSTRYQAIKNFKSLLIQVCWRISKKTINVFRQFVFFTIKPLLIWIDLNQTPKKTIIQNWKIEIRDILGTGRIPPFIKGNIISSRRPLVWFEIIFCIKGRIYLVYFINESFAMIQYHRE